MVTRNPTMRPTVRVAPLLARTVAAPLLGALTGEEVGLMGLMSTTVGAAVSTVYPSTASCAAKLPAPVAVAAAVTALDSAVAAMLTVTTV